MSSLKPSLASRKDITTSLCPQSPFSHICMLTLVMKPSLATLSKLVIPLPKLPLSLPYLFVSPEHLPLSPILYISLLYLVL